MRRGDDTFVRINQTNPFKIVTFVLVDPSPVEGSKISLVARPGSQCPEKTCVSREGNLGEDRSH